MPKRNSESSLGADRAKVRVFFAEGQGTTKAFKKRCRR